MAEKKDTNEPVQEQEKELAERFYMGKCLIGMPNMSGPYPLVFCGVTEKHFVFRKGTKGDEIGRIPRDRISSIISENNQSLKIAWSDAQGTPYTTVFYFDNKNKAERDQTKEVFNAWRTSTA